ncbi:diacylglycerol/lipid kinase family protein [Leucobacter soli]|uniref:Diacylglycerol kinase n=1 Tax=Leucobacter soli TaxID=2812850 RepID=A0A916NHY9_9MICO|nr:diacylglycerol kinase family protein [Leucobacter soli]CAG7613093.1 Diacylglycerol kinase [Leucobacter soli]
MADTPASPQPRAAVVYHPMKTDLEGLRVSVRRYEARAGWAATRWYETDEADAGIAATRRAVEAGASVILASGGDGTVRAVAEALRGSGVPLAIVPQGTGNLLARNIGLPLGDIDEAARAAFLGRNRSIDLGVITITRPPGDDDEEAQNEHVFLVLAGMGLDARAITATSSKLKKRVGWLAYVDAGFRTMVKDAPLRIHYSVDGSAVQSLTVYTVMIGNCGVLPGGVLLIPEAELDDGLLDVVALRPLGPFSWLRIWHKIGWENGVLRKSKVGRRMIDLVHDTRNVTYLRAARYALSVPHPEPIQLDGDDFGLALAASGSVDPGALVIRVLPEWAPPQA